MQIRWLGGVAALLSGVTMATAQTATRPATPPELGTINWSRDFDAAQTTAEKTKRPLLVLFQEVPGCSTCKSFGGGALSHPLIVEAAETLFVPVAIFNNAGGADRTVLDSFNEPAWNNPVLRFVRADRSELTPRLADQYSAGAVANSMTAAIEKAGGKPPAWLQLVAAEQVIEQRRTERATFAMHCFWEGEARLGGLDGVLRTTAGMLERDEVVEVIFDPAVIPYESLLAKAREMECATRVYTRSDAQQKLASEKAGKSAVRTDAAIRPDREPKYHLLKSPYAPLPLTPTQASRVNSEIARGGDVVRWLSPRQIDLLKAIRSKPDSPWPSAVNVELNEAWKKADALAR